jgi:hypothetical protein
MKKTKTSILLAAFLIGGGMFYLQENYLAQEVVHYGAIAEAVDNLYKSPKPVNGEVISMPEVEAESEANDASPVSDVSNTENPSQSLDDDTENR